MLFYVGKGQPVMRRGNSIIMMLELNDYTKQLGNAETMFLNTCNYYSMVNESL